MNQNPQNLQKNNQSYQPQEQNQNLQQTPQKEKPNNSHINSPFSAQFQIICEYHQDEFYTNFCIQAGCMIPLCPECLDEHTIFHRENNTHSDIRAFKNVRQKCSQKLKEGTLVINKQLELIEKNQTQKHSFNNQTKEIEMIKNQIILQITDKIQDLINKLEGNDSHETHSGMQGLREKIQAIMQELSKLTQNLDGPKSVESIKKLLAMDFKKIHQDFNNQYNQHQAEIALLDVFVHEERIPNVEAEIDKFIFLQKNTGLKKSSIMVNSQMMNNIKNELQKQEIEDQSKQYFETQNYLKSMVKSNKYQENQLSEDIHVSQYHPMQQNQSQLNKIDSSQNSQYEKFQPPSDYQKQKYESKQNEMKSQDQRQFNSKQHDIQDQRQFNSKQHDIQDQRQFNSKQHDIQDQRQFNSKQNDIQDQRQFNSKQHEIKSQDQRQFNSKQNDIQDQRQFNSKQQDIVSQDQRSQQRSIQQQRSQQQVLPELNTQFSKQELRSQQYASIDQRSHGQNHNEQRSQKQDLTSQQKFQSQQNNISNDQRSQKAQEMKSQNNENKQSQQQSQNRFMNVQSHQVQPKIDQEQEVSSQYTQNKISQRSLHQNLNSNRSLAQNQTSNFDIQENYQSQQHDYTIQQPQVTSVLKLQTYGKKQKDDQQSNQYEIQSNDSKLFKSQKFQANKSQEFFENSPNRYLHFFPNNMKSLYIFKLDDNQNDHPHFQEIELNIKFKIPYFHKSIITADGKIFLLGGSIADTNYKSNQTYLLNFHEQNLETKAQMIQGRSSFALAQFENFIFVVGGFLSGQIFSNTCEKYNIQTDTWQTIASLNNSAVACSICAFANKGLYKFGGLKDADNLNNVIEFYDINLNTWTIINAKCENNLKAQLYSTSCSIQMNQKEILIFGGYNQQNDATNECQIFNTESNQLIQNSYLNLPFAEGFWNNTPIIYHQKIYAIQNIANETNDDCIETNRKILMFDGKWFSIN